jgi:hypothetical protein
MPRPRRRPVRPSQDRVRRLTELGEWHRDWQARNADAAAFRPGDHPKRDSDYNVHHVDLDAPVEAQGVFHRGAREIMGLD